MRSPLARACWRRRASASAPSTRKNRLIVLADAAVAKIHGATLNASLDAAGFRTDVIEVPAGEASKGFQTFSGVLEKALALGVDRRTTIVALGGGVIGDLAGFAASVLLRGLDFHSDPNNAVGPGR